MKVTTAKAKACLPSITLERRDGDKHRYHTASRDAYSGVRTQWHEPNDAKEKSELIGEDDNPKRLSHTYPNQEAAEQAAKSEMNRVKRGKATLQFTVSVQPSHIATSVRRV